MKILRNLLFGIAITWLFWFPIGAAPPMSPWFVWREKYWWLTVLHLIVSMVAFLVAASLDNDLYEREKMNGQ